MSKIIIRNGTTAAFWPQRKEIIGLYNASKQEENIAFFMEDDSDDKINDPNIIYTFSVAGVAGGMIVNCMPELGLASIMFAAFPKEHRGKGNLTKCVTKAKKYLAKKGLKLACVEVGPTDNGAVWKRLGFIYSGNINLAPHLLTEPAKTLFPEKSQRNNGLSLEDLEMALGRELFK